MAANTEFIQLIKAKCAGRPYNVEEYVTRIDQLIAHVYANRYGSLSGPGSRGGFLRVEFESFQNDCWARLEENGLILKIRDLSFSEDAHLHGYIKKAFENMLQDGIHALSPGSQSRIKQVQRVLKPHVLDSCRILCRCWKLLDFKDIPLFPADLAQLMQASRSLTPPHIHIRNTADGGPVPTIRDEEMAQYLVSLLKGAGGMTTQADLLSFISIQYALVPMRQVAREPGEADSQGSDDESPEEQMERLAYRSDDLLIGMDHVMMARDLVGAMSPRMKEIYYRRIILEETMEEVAAGMNKSVGTVFNAEKAYQKLFYEYFWDHEAVEIPEEVACVGRLVSDLIERMRGKK
jgi:hypothetical protein